MFADRAGWDLTPNALAQRLAALRAAGADIIDLTESNPTRCSFSYPPELLAPLADPGSFRYEPSPKGLLSARESICRYYAEQRGVAVEPEQVVLTASSSEAYSWIFRLLANPGDRVLAPQPSYPLFGYLAGLNDVRLDPYPLVYGDGWRVDPDRLRAAVQPDARAIIAVNPNNPTGSLLSAEDLQVLQELGQSGGSALICDEVFADYLYPESVGWFRNAASRSDMLTFTLGGISKSLGLPQMKLGWIVVTGPKSLRDDALARLEVIADTYLSVNTPVQRALPQWMEQRQTIRQQILQRVLDNRRYLIERSEASGVCRVLQADGGWYAVLRVPNVSDEERFCLDLLARDHVLLHPGYFFDFPNTGYLILSLLLRSDKFCNGVKCLLQHLVIAGDSA